MTTDPWPLLASSQRLTVAFLEAQLAELSRAGLGGSEWAVQMRGAVERIKPAVPGDDPPRVGRPSFALVDLERGA